MSVCSLCSRQCNIDRSVSTGFCGVPALPKISRAALHFWEEPCISGEGGSGTVFFSGCTLKCVFCQNRSISRGQAGMVISENRLTEIFLELQAKGAHNINLVTPDHYAHIIPSAVGEARLRGLSLPVLVNTGGYITDKIYDLLSPVTDIWLTDFKYSDPALSAKYSAAPDYPAIAEHALSRMMADTGAPVFDEKGMLLSGVVVRILLLPGCLQDACQTVKHIYELYGDNVIFSLMNQYTPPSEGLPDYPELQRKVTDEEYDTLVDYAIDLGIENAFIQEGDTQEESFIPEFDLTGV